MRAGRKADAAMAAASLLIDAVDKLTGVVTEINERQESLIQSVGSLTGVMELALTVEGVSLKTLVEVCDQLDRKDLLVKLRDHLEMVNEATEAASAWEGGPDL